jgi:regulator of protease activity HflC (stomatin/prohibitin superfamily)
MQTDHYAYQQATKVSIVGLLLQLLVGIVLLVFSLVSNDTTMHFAALFALGGVIVWVGLIMTFNQHRLERLEALEEDQLIAGGTSAQSFFETAGDDARVAASRLRLMHKWMMPIASVLLAIYLATVAAWMLRYLGNLDASGDQFDRITAFHLTSQLGWQIAIALGFAVVCFILSRFAAGMAEHEAWQNLRGGAAYMVGTSIILVAVTVGVIVRFFHNDAVIEIIAWGIPLFMLALAIEVLLNLALNIYRPRKVDEVPRPAFDSRVLSLFASPDNLVRSLNEAVNYQFGFDVTSSWGYQLLLRSALWLLGLGIAVLLGLSTMSVVEPREEGLRLRFGKIMGQPEDQVHDSGLLWKLPWPVESSDIHDVRTIREVWLTARPRGIRPVNLWSDDLNKNTDETIEPFLVAATSQQRSGENDSAAADLFAMVDAQIVMYYRVRSGEGDGLISFLNFASDETPRGRRLSPRDEILRTLSLGEVTEVLASRMIDDVLGADRAGLGELFKSRIQKSLDALGAGVDIVSVSVPMVRPAGEAAAAFEEISVGVQNQSLTVDAAQRQVAATNRDLLGDAASEDAVYEAVVAYNALQKEVARLRAAGDTAGAEVAQQQKLQSQRSIDQMLVDGGGNAGVYIEQAERDRWVEIMKKRSQAGRVAGQIGAYRAAPELYRQQGLMGVYMSRLAGLRKYIVGVEPDRLHLNVELRELTSQFSLEGTRSTDQGTSP